MEMEKLRNFYFSRQWRNLESEKEEDKEQELCDAIVHIMFNIMWKGYDAHQKLVWKVNKNKMEL